MSTTNESSNIEERLAMLESNKKFEATKEAIQEREVEFLAQLRLIKSEMTAKDGGGKGASATTDSSSTAKEMEQLKIENEQLKALVAKQSFRIKHLVDEMEKKQIYKQR